MLSLKKKKKENICSQAWWSMPMTPTLGRQEEGSPSLHSMLQASQSNVLPKNHCHWVSKCLNIDTCSLLEIVFFSAILTFKF